MDATPLLDIKPHAPQFDGAENVRTGWLERKVEKAARHRSDGRFRK